MKGNIRLARTDIKVVVDAGNGAGGPLALATHARARAQARGPLLRDGRPLPQPPPRPDAARERRGAHRAGARARTPRWASPTTATPTASARSTPPARSSGATSSWWLRPVGAGAAPGRGDPWRGEVLADPLRRHREARRPAHHVEDRALPHQGQDEGGARPARRGDVGARVLRRPVLRLRRRHLRVAAAAGDRGGLARWTSRTCSPTSRRPSSPRRSGCPAPTR
jgi:hypothetical protein